ncbi:MAG TPA: SRPBCC domain-containing protein [Acidimicrobiales bacterium]
MPTGLTRDAAYRTTDGTTGEVRSLRPGDRIRLTWRPPSWDHDSTVQVALGPSATGTVVRVHQERLAGPDERERMRAHWSAALDALAPLLDVT